jgi:uncharacterized membrane protein
MLPPTVNRLYASWVSFLTSVDGVVVFFMFCSLLLLLLLLLVVVVVVLVLLFSIVKNAVTSKNSKKISNSSKEALAAIHIKKALIDKTGTLHGMAVIEEEVSGPNGPTRGVVFRMELN